MGGAVCCGKAFLVIINIIFMVLGAASLGGGLFLKFGQSVTLGLVGPMIDSLTSAAPGGSGGGSGSSASSELTATFDVAAYVLIGLGAFMLVVGVIGCCGACCSTKVLLALYATAVLLVFIAKIVILALWLTKSVDKQIFDAMNVDVINGYAGPLSLNPDSLLLNVIMVELHCCGVSNYTEFQQALKWNRTFVYSQGGVSVSVNQIVPVTCCKVTGSFPAITPVDNNCTITPTSFNTYIDTSCHSAVQAQIDTYKAAVFGTYAGILAFEVLCAAVAICLAVKEGQKDNKVAPQ